VQWGGLNSSRQGGDLRSLETLCRILSFITLGLILLGVSWVYTRLRDRLKAYL
jgi:uncharacterized membrane protein